MPESGLHYPAAFQVVVGDRVVDFSSSRYMHTEACLETSEAETPTAPEEQIEKAFLVGGVGDIVHVRREGAIWQDLFTNLQYEFPSPVIGFVNGERVDRILEMPIEAYQRVVFVSGSYSDLEGKAQDLPSLDAMKRAVRDSETCESS